MQNTKNDYSKKFLFKAYKINVVEVEEHLYYYMKPINTIGYV